MESSRPHRRDRGDLRWRSSCRQRVLGARGCGRLEQSSAEGLRYRGIRLTEWTALLRQVRDADVEFDACAVGVGAGDDRATDSIVFRERSDVLSPLGIVLSDRSAAGEDCREKSQPEGRDGR